MFKCLYHPGRVGTRCLNLITLNSYHSFRISEATDKHFHLSSITFYMLRKDILSCLLDYLTIVIAIILLILLFIGHIVQVSEKPLFESRSGDQNLYSLLILFYYRRHSIGLTTQLFCYYQRHDFF